MKSEGTIVRRIRGVGNMREIPTGEGIRKGLHIQLLGGFAVSLDGVRIPEAQWKSRRGRNLVKLLALTPGHRLHRDQVCETFWPDSAPSASTNNFHQTLYAARRVFEANGAGELILEEGFLTLAAGSRQALTVDVEQFEAAAAHTKDDPEPNRYETALALYAGDLLPDDLYEEWTLPRRDALRQTCLQLLLDLARLHETRREYPQGIAALQHLLSMDQSHEEAHAGLMRLYTLSGQRRQAVHQYQVLQDVLSQELGVEPNFATAQLYEAIQSGRFSPVPSRSQPTHNLPVSLTAFIGREDEIETLKQLVLSGRNRLVTVVGSGGSGKTCLALETARDLLPVFPDGVYLVELDARQKQETLAPLIAQVLGLGQAVEFNAFGSQARQNLDERLFSFLQDKKLLLVLDGFEGMLAESGWLNSLLRRTAGLVILATSRVRLNLNAEQIFTLEGLPYPQPACETGDLESFYAVQLFVQAARRARPSFTLTTENGQHVAELCRALQGMPLGILLAAAWMGALEPQQISGQIRHSLDFLTANQADLPDRQRSLRATFEYSLQLLGEAERTAFTRLSVFRGAFTAERAGQAAQVALPTLKILVDHSLLRPAAGGRFRIHELLRQFAQEKLAADPDEERAVHERHCQVFMTALTALEPRLKSNEVFDAVEEMDQEYPDLLEAWDWAVEYGYIELLDTTVWALGRYQTLRDLYNEGASLCQKTMNRLERDGLDPQNLRLWVRLGNLLVNFLIRQTQYETCAQVLAQIEKELYARPGLAVNLRREQAFLQISQGEYYIFSGRGNYQALNFFQKGMDLLYGTEDAWDIGFGLQHVALGHGGIGNFRESQRFAELGLETQRPSGDPTLVQRMLNLRGYALMFSGQSAEAMRTVEEEVAYLQRFKDHPHNTAISSMRGAVRFHAGLFEQARAYLEQSLALFNLPEDRETYFTFLWILDLIHLAFGDYDAIRLGPDMSAEDRLGIKDTAHQYNVHLTWGILDLLRQDWAKAELNFQSFLHYQEKVSALHMIGVALTLLGFTAYRRDDLPLARDRLIAALENGLKYGYYIVFCFNLGVVALILAEAGQLEQAVELYAAATAHPGAGNSRWFEDVLGKPVARLGESLPTEIAQAARNRGRSRTLEAASREVLEKLKAAPDLLAFASNQAAP